MSAIPPAVAAALHLTDLSVRFAVGKWSHLSLNTIVIFNTVDIGLLALIRSVTKYFKKKYAIEHTHDRKTVVKFSSRIVTCLAAFYTASWLNHPLSARQAMLTTLTAYVTRGCIVKSFYPKKPNVFLPKGIL